MRVFHKEPEDEKPFYEISSRRKKNFSTITEGEGGGQDEDDETAQICAICREKIKNEETVIELKCQHLYHTECSKEWILEKRSCPQCRRRLHKQFISPNAIRSARQ